ncbi:PAS domain-containing protein [Cupriavidus basilensis]
MKRARLAASSPGRRDYVNAILAHLNEGVAAVDAEGRIQTYNPAMERAGTAPAAALGRKLQRWLRRCRSTA